MANVTMRDIGRITGVSAVTVSKALAGKSGMSEETRQRIIRVAREMGYVNPGAGQSSTARSLDVGILIPDQFFSPDSFYAALYKDLVQALTDQGHFGILEMLSAQAEAELALPHLISGRQVDALVVLGQPSKAYRQMIAQQETPVIFLDFYDPSISADAVVGDNFCGAARLTDHLIARGHRDIGFVGYVRATSSIMERYTGYASTMILAGLPLRRDLLLRDRDEQGNFLPLVLPEKRPTALVCHCDMAAMRVIEQLEAQGIRVPEDISVTGYDDFLPGGAAPSGLTTFRMDRKAMVQATIRLIWSRSSDVKTPLGRIVVGGEMVCRDSVKTLET